MLCASGERERGENITLFDDEFVPLVALDAPLANISCLFGSLLSFYFIFHFFPPFRGMNIYQVGRDR